MTIALRTHLTPVHSHPPSSEGRSAVGAQSPQACLLARLPVVADTAAPPAIYQPDTFAWPHESSSAFVVAQHTARNRHGALVAMTGNPMVAHSTGLAPARITARKLLELYEARGTACLGMLLGSWSLVILDPARNRVLLANDRMGRQSLYYSLGQEFVLIGSSLDELSVHTNSTGLDAQALYQYVYFHMVPAPGAILHGYNKLGSASMLELGPAGYNLQRYWVPAFKETPSCPLARVQAELKYRLKTAVKRCTVDSITAADGPGRVGAFLSGGLDSSTVAGMLSELQGGSCDAYGIGFDVEGYDEMSYARLAARHFGVRLHEHRVNPEELVQALPALAASFDEPFGNSSVMPAYFCARMAAEDGIDMLLAGDGGDELFAGNTRYAGQKVFEDYINTPPWLRTRVVEPLLGELPAGLPLLSKARSFVRQANMSLPQRLQYYSFLEQNSPQAVFLPEFLRSVDTSGPRELLSRIYHAPEQASSLNRMLFLDWQVTLADNDLRKVNQACALAGVAVRYPMLDDDLVKFSTTIPSAWKLPGNGSKGRRLRHFYKEALAGWLPEATLRKGKHGFGLPFGIWMKTHKPLQQLAFDNILALKARGIFQPRFLDQAIASHRNGHAAYYGELIWVLMCLELWLVARQPGYHFGRSS